MRLAHPPLTITVPIPRVKTLPGTFRALGAGRTFIVAEVGLLVHRNYDEPQAHHTILTAVRE